MASSLVFVCFFCQAVLGDDWDPKKVSTIYFGSCIKQDKPVPILKAINRNQPDAFIFLGDNIYADTDDMQVMRNKYAKLAADPEFKKLRQKTKILATWDDHDYGKNDAGAEYKMKQQSREVFFDFWQVPKNSPRRKHEGVYHSQFLGPTGRKVQVILLDTRYFRGPLKVGKRKTGGPYYPTDDKTIPLLGETQWKWLEEQLSKPAEIRIIASSIQLISESDGQETWSNLPHERERFFNLLRKTKANGVFIISGDRHWSELSCYEKDMPYPLYDLTSSSLNQPHGRGTPTLNRFRSIDRTYHKENFGAIEFNWTASPPVVELQIVAANGRVELHKKLRLSELRASSK